MGSIKITNTQNQEAKFATASGFVEVKDNKVSILVENAINSKDIDSDKLSIEIADLKEKLRSTVDKGEIQQLKKLISEIENQFKLVN
jgi:F0F1-type ATP synthase epsilon subunit